MPSPEYEIGVYNALKTEKSTLDTVLQDIKTYIMVNKDDVTLKEQTPGQRNNSTRQFDPTAPHANNLLAASMAGTLTPSTSQWFLMRLRDDKLNSIKEIKDWFQDSSIRQFNAYIASNFGDKFHEGYLDLGGFGTTAVFQEEAPRDADGSFTGLTFDTFPIDEYVFLEGRDGRAGEFYRNFKMTAEQARDKFSEHPAFKGLGPKMQKALESGKPEDKAKKFEILHVIRERQKFVEGVDRDMQMPIESIYIAKDDKHTIQKGGYQEFPVAVPRWSKLTADAGWGRGPGWVALPTVKRLNRIHELGLKALAKDVSPPLMVPHKGVIGGLKTRPNAINYYNAAKYQGAKPEYLTSGSRWDIAQFNIESMERKINQIFFSDQLQMQDGPQMTAAEAQIRYELMQRLLGPTFWRLVNELFAPTLIRSFNIMLRGDAFDDMPPILEDMVLSGNAPELDITYTGSLARSQRQEEVIAIQRTYELAGGIAQQTGDVSIFDNLDGDEALKYGADQIGLPSKILRSDDDRGAIRDGRQQAQEQQAQMDQAQQVASIADTGASAEEKMARAV